MNISDCTQRRGAGIKTILHEFLDDGTQIYNDLAGLNLMHL